ncbi:unnamed protein product, partial [Prorocentrum cordatum]
EMGEREAQLRRIASAAGIRCRASRSRAVVAACGGAAICLVALLPRRRSGGHVLQSPALGRQEDWSQEVTRAVLAPNPSCLSGTLALAGCRSSGACAAPKLRGCGGEALRPAGEWSRLMEFLRARLDAGSILFAADAAHVSFAYSCCSPRGREACALWGGAVGSFQFPDVRIRLHDRVVCVHDPKDGIPSVYLALVADHESQLRLFGAVRSFERALGGAERREQRGHGKPTQTTAVKSSAASEGGK